MKIDSTNAPAIIKQLLESHWALTSIDGPNEQFERLHDDHDGTYQGMIGVMRSIDGDMYVWTSTNPQAMSDWLRFRTFGGGGRSLRTHNALRILAEAIRLDAIEDPHEPPPQRSG